MTQVWLEMGLKGRNPETSVPRISILQLQVEEAGGGKTSHPDLENPFLPNHLFNFPHLFANFNSRPILMSFRVPNASSQAEVGAGSCWVGSRWGEAISRAASALSSPSLEHCEHPHDCYHDYHYHHHPADGPSHHGDHLLTLVHPHYPTSTYLMVLSYFLLEDGGVYLIWGQGCN